MGKFGEINSADTRAGKFSEFFFDIFPHGVLLTLLPFTPEGIVVGF